MEDVDLKLHLLSNSPIEVDGLKITPYTIREIKDYGYTRYMTNLQWISAAKEDFIDAVDDYEKKMILKEQAKELSAFDFFVKFGGGEMLQILLRSLSMVFRTDDIKMLDDHLIAINYEKLGIIYYDEDGNMRFNEEKLKELGEGKTCIVHRGNFEDIVQVVKLQNYLSKPKKERDKDMNPVDEETRELMEEMERMRAKVEAKKKAQKRQEKGDDGDIDIYDIVDAVSSKSNSINKINIWDLGLYQLYTEYSRLELIENYDISIRAMMAGAEKIELTHWSSKL